jgi:DNA-binding GntR family transcriptional regulator
MGFAPATPGEGPASLPGPGRRTPYERLKESIYLGDLAPGQHLVETALAEMYDVSRTPIREALMRLEQDGLLIRDRNGLTVREHSPAEILDLYEVRILLETEAGRVAADRRTENDMLALKKVAKRYEAGSIDDPRGLVELNRHFHEAVWACAHQLALTDLLERLEQHLGRFPVSTLTYPGRWEQTIEQHRAIVRAIDARDGNRAGELCGQHFRNAREIRLQLWENET